MSVPQGKVPIVESIQAAWSTARRMAPGLAPAAAVAAALAALFNFLSLQNASGSPALQLVESLGAGFALALFAATAMVGALGGPTALNAAGARLAVKLFAAMIVIGFFLVILFTVAAIPGFIILGAALAPYSDDLKKASGDPDATMQFLSAHSEPFVALAIVFSLIWLAVTSRLYLAGPASVAEDRVATFETWKWTQGNLLRIMATRLGALLPLAIVSSMIQLGVTTALGFDALDPIGLAEKAVAAPAKFAIVTFVSAFVNFLVYASCEAALSTYLYRGLKPPA